jgi:hypothetical protein
LLPYSTCGLEGPCARGLPANRGTSAGFDYPLDALPFDASPVLFRTGSAHGIHPSKLSPRKRHPEVSHGEDPRTVGRGPQLPEDSHVRATSVSGLCSFRESLAIKPVFSGSITGCSLGFRSSRAFGQKPGPGFRPNSSYMLDCVNGAYATCTKEYRSASAWFNRAATASRGERPNNPRRVPAPVGS